ncbi:organic hydroperoxide resistance protein [Caryophanon tenue]|uniref:Organic hydroperoxide resistance protein OhrA n=1 Tax=Caryophanon tenue TaxID=33978 RepID=A0A1C0YAW2_9BACL|nr:organic hydroperoxide resistance protein [Caryophanon tenue]OCS84326.1 Organic hydroperoxide resistance protein OhrA [Caryophanon tenue]
MATTLFTAAATAFGGREGKVHSEDGVLQLETAMPGTPRASKVENATNPEQLFAAGYAACFDSALQSVARQQKVKFDSEVTANVSLLKGDDGFSLAVTLQVKGTNIERAQLEELVHQAHQVCPYSKATRNNIDVTLEVVE